MITYKIKVIWIFWIVERFFCKPWRDVVTLHRLSIADGIGKANAGQPSRSTAHPGSKRPEVRATYISSLGSPVGLWFLCRPHILKPVQREPGYLRKRDDLQGDEP